MTTLGLDIGGASIKSATHTGMARSARFPLWKAPQQLAAELRKLTAGISFDQLAITMTGELCDGFETKQEGVTRILDSVDDAFPDRHADIHVWQTTGNFVSTDRARQTPWQTGAANWLAIATFAARYTDQQPALLIDIGSTTSDLIPIHLGHPVPAGRTDPERLATGELIYTGARRTPLCALLPTTIIAGITYRTMAELFATTLDAYLLLGDLPEDPTSSETADQRPETIAKSIDRLSRMIGSDRTAFTRANAHELATHAANVQLQLLIAGLKSALSRAPFEQPHLIITSGEGEFLARRLAHQASATKAATVISLAEKLDADRSRAACAYAVATLLNEMR